MNEFEKTIANIDHATRTAFRHDMPLFLEVRGRPHDLIQSAEPFQCVRGGFIRNRLQKLQGFYPIVGLYVVENVIDYRPQSGAAIVKTEESGKYGIKLHDDLLNDIAIASAKRLQMIDFRNYRVKANKWPNNQK